MAITKKRLALLGGLLGLILIVWFNLHHKPKQAPATVKVTEGDITEKAVAIGQILPEHAVKVKSQVAGIVAKLLRQEGEYIEAGQVLAQIQPTPSPERYDQLRREAEIKQVAEQARQVELESTKKLFELQAIDKMEYDKAQEAYKTARLERLQADEQLALAEHGKVTIGDHKISSEIVSPVSGYILATKVNEGEPVVALSEMQAGDVLFIIADMQHLLFKGEVNELDAVKVKPGMPATITIGALPNETITGKVNRIALQSEQASDEDSKQDKSKSKFNVGFRIEISDLQGASKAALKSGYSATAEIITKSLAKVPLIPERLLIFKQGQSYVQLMDSKGKTQLQPIKTGLSDGINVQILQGLQPGQHVLDNPMPPDKQP